MCALNGLRPIVLVLATSFAVLGLCDTAVNTSDTAANTSNTPDTAVGPPGAPRTKRLTTFGKSANMPSPSPPLSAGIVVGAAGITECRTQLDCELIQYTECRVLSASASASASDEGTRAVCLCMDNALPVNGACSARPRDTRGYVPFGNRRPNKASWIEPMSTRTWEENSYDQILDKPLFRPHHEETNTQSTMLSSHVPTIFRPSLRKPVRRKALRTPCNSDNECLEGAECVINPNATVNINQRMCYCMPGWLEVEGYCNGSSIESASILITLTFAVLLATFSQM